MYLIYFLDMENSIEKDTAEKQNSTAKEPEKQTTSKRTYTRLEFTLEQEEQLIEFVKANPVLYDPIDAQYKNRNYRDRLWNEFGTRIEKSGLIF